jgi:hypothetical protein
MLFLWFFVLILFSCFRSSFSHPAASSASAPEVMAQCQSVLAASAQLIFAGNQHDLTVAGDLAVDVWQETIALHCDC